MTAPDARVVVLGDLMLDVSEVGEVTRVSPEAPVVVVLNTTRRAVLGGAGNTAANTASLGRPTTVLGIVGDDAEGAECVALTESTGLLPRLVRAPGHPTTTKTRFLSSGQQIMRWDRELAEVPAAAVEELTAAVAEALEGAGALVISDYDKGVITEEVARTAIAAARDAGVPVVVDTKKRDVRCFAGCTVIAPNHHEARGITGHTDPELAARAIAAVTGSGVIVTRGAHGMLIADGEDLVSIPSDVREVSDVTGAGDTVTAGLAVALADGARTLADAARWANSAAAVAVSHAGTYAVPRAAVTAELHR